jgi:endopolyphosphatase
VTDALSNETVHTTGKHKELYTTLLKDFDHLSKAQDKLDYSGLAVANVAPSVVPNPYLPSFRIFAYNTTGTKYMAGLLGETDTSSHRLGDFVDRDGLCNGAAGNASWKCRLNSPWYSSPHSPSRTNRLYTPIGFAQVSAFVTRVLDRVDRRTVSMAGFGTQL